VQSPALQDGLIEMLASHVLTLPAARFSAIRRVTHQAANSWAKGTSGNT
jgi:hypothetical protein